MLLILHDTGTVTDTLETWSEAKIEEELRIKNEMSVIKLSATERERERE